MAANGLLDGYRRWRNENAEFCLFAQLMSGGFLLGSSMAYPILAQEESAWAPVTTASRARFTSYLFGSWHPPSTVIFHCLRQICEPCYGALIAELDHRALDLFFLSAGLFNSLKIPEICEHGYLTVVVCIAAMVLIGAFGRTTLGEHCRFIPVYLMASILMTAAWPSLLRNLGVPQEAPEDQFMEIQERQPRPPPPQPRFHDGENDLEEGNQMPHPVRPDQTLLIHMGGPSSGYSHGSTRTNSMSLSSRASLPSEMSDNVKQYFQPEIDGRDPTTIPRITSRRADIDALAWTDESCAAEPSLLQARIRKSQSL